MSSLTETETRDATDYGIFVSHINEEAHLARNIKDHLVSALGDDRVFVSADDIRLGDDWRWALGKALKRTRALIVLCSPRSIRRPWVNFESGSGWARGVPVIPVCHSGLRKADLPDPLRTFQVLELVDERDCRRLVEQIGVVLNLKANRKYDYQGMAETLFELPPRGTDIGVVLTHRQDEWADETYTVFNLADRLPGGLAGEWKFAAVTKTDDLLSVNLHTYAGLIVGSPWRRRMEPEVVAALADFVLKGGRMLLLGFEMGDRHHDANLNDLAAQFGLYFEADIVGLPRKRKSKKNYGEEKPYDVPVDFKIGDEDGRDKNYLTTDLETIKLANVQTLRVLPLGREWLLVGDNVACRPSRQTVQYRNGTFAEPREKKIEPNFDAGWLAVAAEAPQGLCGAGGVQAVGTWDLLGRKEPFDHRDNLVLLGRLFNWLSRRDFKAPFRVSKVPPAEVGAVSREP